MGAGRKVIIKNDLVKLYENIYDRQISKWIKDKIKHFLKK
ncbi:hypothetical protein CNEO2_100003 [Clostridium neonatale]|nr:hypothetical protein CNEO2_100003 [Clostridium neonatale]